MLCKPSRDEDSRKIFLAVMPNQGSAERRHKRNGHCYANRMDIHGQPTLWLVRYSSGEWAEKGNCEETDKKQKTDIDSIDRQGFIKLACPGTSHLTSRRAVGHPIRPPPPHAISHLPPHRNLAVKPRTKLRSLLGPGKTETAFSVQQPCEWHVWQPPAAAARQPQESRPAPPPPSTLCSVAERMPTS